ncbi:MAG: hypothetical protein U5N86_06795 [Planctomycetota bacterium]|nr:hypothetical protein [Planctomycetota bacterium]
MGKRTGHKRLMYIALVAFVVILAIAVVSYSVWRGAQYSALKEEIAKVEATGESMDISRYYPEHVNDEDNGSDELLKAASVARKCLVSAGILEEGRATLTRLRLLVINQEWGKLRKFISECEEEGVFELIEEGLAAPHHSFNTANEVANEHDSTYLVETRHLFTLLLVRAATEVEEEATEDVYHACESAFTLAHVFDDVPRLIAQLMSIAHMMTSVEVVEKSHISTYITDDELQHLQSRLLEFKPVKQMRFGLVSERAYRHALLREVATGNVTIRSGNDITPDSSIGLTYNYSGMSSSLHMKMYLPVEQLWNIRYFNSILSAIDMQYQELQTVEPPFTEEQVNKYVALSWVGPEHISLGVSKAVARIRCCDIALELLKTPNRVKLGSTEDLLALTGFEGERITDPFSGDMLRAKVTGEDGKRRLVVYSVGRNGVDDGGSRDSAERDDFAFSVLLD